MSRTPMYRGQGFAPNPNFVPPSRQGGSGIRATIKAVCDYCLHIAEEYKFDMEPLFLEDCSQFGSDIIFNFKAPSMSKNKIIAYEVKISSGMSVDSVLEQIKDVASGDDIIMFRKIDAMTSILDHSMILQTTPLYQGQ